MNGEKNNIIDIYSKLGVAIFVYGIFFIFSLCQSIFSGVLQLFSQVLLNSGLDINIYQMFILYQSTIFFGITIIKFIIMAIIIARINALEKLNLGVGNTKFFFKFLIAFILSILGYFINYILNIITPVLNMQQFSLVMAIKQLIYAIFLISSTIIYYKTWNNLSDFHFRKTNILQSQTAQKCRSAIGILKLALVFSLLIYVIPIFTNLINGFYFGYGNIIALIFVFIGQIFNSGTSVIVNILFVIAYFRLGRNLKQLKKLKKLDISPTINAPDKSAPAVPKFCPQCGNEIKQGSSFCQFCGTKI
ncbi:MAG: zinc ribbon domain-containing protein [Promethearchaeota archaeon]